MRKLLIFLCLCLMISLPALAEDTQTVRGATFTLELPADWTVDVDEYTHTTHKVINHVLHPTIIFAGNDDYALVVTTYDHPSEIRYRLSGRGDRAQEHFNVIAEHSGLVDIRGVISSRMVKSLHDIRNFVLCRIPNADAHLATYYNPDKGLGFTFRLEWKNSAITPEAADALLLEICSSLREDGYFYPADATGRNVVITHPTANIRLTPDQNGEKLRTAAQGESYPYYGQTSSWYIINVDGVTGYVSTALSQLQ